MPCCEGCGRETRGMFCVYCRIGGRIPKTEMLDRPRLSGRWPDDVFDADDFGDEADADSVVSYEVKLTEDTEDTDG